MISIRTYFANLLTKKQKKNANYAIIYHFFPFLLTRSLSTTRMAYGNESGLVIVDIVQKVCLFNVASPDLYGAQDPYSRTPRSPKRSEPYSRDEQRSPSIDQVSDLCFSVIFLFNV
jgi:hypothetical protein